MQHPSHKKFLACVISAGVLAWVGFYFVFQRLNPFDTGALALVLFYLTFFFGSASIFILLGYLIRFYMYRHETYFIHLNLALRQGILLAVLASFLLVFQSMRILTWWDSALLIIVLILLEFYFIARSRRW